jgi:hypothetical protein
MSVDTSRARRLVTTILRSPGLDRACDPRPACRARRSALRPHGGALVGRLLLETPRGLSAARFALTLVERLPACHDALHGLARRDEDSLNATTIGVKQPLAEDVCPTRRRRVLRGVSAVAVVNKADEGHSGRYGVSL